jgi:hypothetical protein
MKTKEVYLSRETKQQISKVVNRYMRIKTKRTIRKIIGIKIK